MQYCMVSDVESYYLGKSFKFQDYLKNSEVETFIIQEAAFINSILRKRYTLPFSDNDDLMLLKMINEKLVVGTIDDIFREKTADGEFERSRNYRKEALDWLLQVLNGEFILSSANMTAANKFNNIDSHGNVVTKRFTIADIEPGYPGRYYDREKHRWVT